ncbi:DNA-binding protein, partial [Nocardia asiatica]
SLTDLERDPDQRTVTLTMLTRLHGMLGLSVDEMLASDRAATGLAEHDPLALDDTAPERHARTLLAVLVSRDGISVDVLLAATGWTSTEFDDALTHLRAQLDPTGLQVVATDIVLHLALRPGVLPGALRQALARPTALRRGLDANTAIELLRLVRKEILRPVPGGAIAVPSEANPERDIDTHRLLDAGIAVGRGTKRGDELAITFDDYDGINDPDQAVAGLRIHPDVMFGLGLADRPARRRPASRRTAPEPSGPE